MTILSSSAEKLVRIGANLEISSDAGYMANKVEDIIRIAASKGSHVTVDAGKYLSSSLENFARIGGKNVTIRI